MVSIVRWQGFKWTDRDKHATWRDWRGRRVDVNTSTEEVVEGLADWVMIAIAAAFCTGLAYAFIVRELKRVQRECHLPLSE